MTKARPILFSAPMIGAILAGRKTQTRRVLPTRWQACDEIEPATTPTGGEIPNRWMNHYEGEDADVALLACPYGVVGDRLWVKETWQLVRPTDWEGNYVEAVELWDDKIPKHEPASDARRSRWRVWYGADLFGRDEDPTIVRANRKDWMVQSWRPSIFMPRWASRITLEITDVRVERLQSISEEDAAAEGVDPMVVLPGDVVSHVAGFGMLWDSINHKRAPWDSNPWVWAISFKVAQS